MAKIRNSGTIINTDYQFSKLIDRSIESVVIPNNISFIGNCAFTHSAIKEVYIPSNIKRIQQNAFSNCNNLIKLEFEDNSINVLETNALMNCSSIPEVILPYGLVTLGLQAVQNCNSLQKIVLPETIVSLGSKAFILSPNLLYVFFKGDISINSTSNGSPGLFPDSKSIRLFDMRYMLSAKDINGITANNVYLYANVPDNLYEDFAALPNWSALNLKRFVHSCDVESFDNISNPQDGHYYSLKNDKNYLNPLVKKQLDVRQFVNNEWIEIDIDA